MKREVFFAGVRVALFDGRLGQSQVAGISFILDEWDRRAGTNGCHLAYMLATAFHETDRTMQPIHELGGAGYLKRMYDVAGSRPALARKMGNTAPGDGVRYCGRGFVQLTWKNNYIWAAQRTGIDLVGDPDRAMEPAIAATIMFDGMSEGVFTGKKLADYLRPGKTDWVGARRIINGTDKAANIAAYAVKFNAAILAAA